MNRGMYKSAGRAYRTKYPTRGLITPPPNGTTALENHLRDLWDDRFISGSRFDEAYHPASMEYRLYQIYGRSHVTNLLKGRISK